MKNIKKLSSILVPEVLVVASVPLDAANDFTVLAGSGITVSGAVNTTTITGDVSTFLTVSTTGLEKVSVDGLINDS